jgi:hypothetical protein
LVQPFAGVAERRLEALALAGAETVEGYGKNWTRASDMTRAPFRVPIDPRAVGLCARASRRLVWHVPPILQRETSVRDEVTRGTAHHTDEHRKGDTEPA